MKYIELNELQKAAILKELFEYIESTNVMCGDDVINIDRASIESKYTMAEIIDIIFKTECNIK